MRRSQCRRLGSRTTNGVSSRFFGGYRDRVVFVECAVCQLLVLVGPWFWKRDAHVHRLFSFSPSLFFSLSAIDNILSAFGIWVGKIAALEVGQGQRSPDGLAQDKGGRSGPWQLN